MRLKVEEKVAVPKDLKVYQLRLPNCCGWFHFYHGSTFYFRLYKYLNTEVISRMWIYINVLMHVYGRVYI